MIRQAIERKARYWSDPEHRTQVILYSRTLGLEAMVKQVAALGGFDAPVIPMAPHPFACYDSLPCCGECGGGILHAVHAADRQAVARG